MSNKTDIFSNSTQDSYLKVYIKKLIKTNKTNTNDY